MNNEGGAAAALLVSTEGASSALCSLSKDHVSPIEIVGFGPRVPLKNANCSEAHETVKDGSAEVIIRSHDFLR